MSFLTSLSPQSLARRRVHDRELQLANPIKSLDMARAHTHTLLLGLHTMNFFFLDYDDANIALGVIQHGVLFLTRGCANRHAACTDGIATAEHSAKGLHTAVAHMLLSLGKGAEKH